MKVDWLVVGAGFTGCVLAERIATQLDKKVLIVERRDHIGGNAYDYYDENGVLVHKYGPHIFHTNSQRVWEYLSQFTAWRRYEHRVLGVIQDKKVPIPFNLNSLYALFPSRQADSLKERLISQYGLNVKVPILRLKEATDPDIRILAEYIYQNVFYGYTLKQWELKPEELDPSVTGRVPVHISWDDRYFQDIYQAMPLEGYTPMFEGMLDHPNIEIRLKTDYRALLDEVRFDRMVYTGSIDLFFDYLYGPLPYRSLRFEYVTLDQEWYQEVGTVNYPNNYAFTRITEQKHLTGQILPETTLVYEYPQAHRAGENEPYYPIPREQNRERHKLYLKEAEKLHGKVIFVGRLGDYKYYNMDQAVARALQLFEGVIANL
ncbi:UDP-galactopyranose mutase [Kyrpidia spormannii]|uniref:UDP-galactopyranose mutase n=2 Tax=Kyrpidia spormannii TaxID=2055160 RepID=A0ACA8Z6A6_9BACL|nr:UDP-galactopyranose mutase [Kyrpidia spormannii]CAB3389561.1 UDP-galactopyranose mutase [Kyrpidia spormannii]CAB3390412.1 UDP-galactopyranose mutase [Kyrpidia spormannii]